MIILHVYRWVKKFVLAVTLYIIMTIDFSELHNRPEIPPAPLPSPPPLDYVIM